MVGATSYSSLVSFNYEGQGRSRFLYNSGDIALEQGSPEVDCCIWARKFRVYNREDPKLAPRGICCRNCNAEYIDVNVYNGIRHQESEVEVIRMETSINVDTDLENSFNVSWEFVNSQSVILKRKRSDFKVNRCLAWMYMVQPHRRYIQHKDPSVIDELRPGDHIAWHRSYTIWHHQLIRENKGNGKCDVIHFSPSNSSWYSSRKAEIKVINDFDFTAERNGTAYKILYDDLIVRENPVDLVFDRAHSRLLEENYNLFVNNCEHFVTFCKTGKQKSIQTIWLRFQIFFLILRIYVLCGILVVFTKYDLLVMKEEKYEILNLIIYEALIGLIIVLWHQRLYRRMAIGKLDRNRRILEAILETFFTICFYTLYVGLLNIPFIKTFMFESDWKIMHVTFVIFFVLVGKITGCLAGNYVSQFMKTGMNLNDTSRERPPLYGAVTIH